MLRKILLCLFKRKPVVKELKVEDLIKVEVFAQRLPYSLLLQTPDLAISIGPEPVPELWALGWTVKVWQQKSGMPVLIYYPPNR